MTKFSAFKLAKLDYAEYARSLAWAILIAIVFRSFAFEPYRIPSGSMIPTLMVGDYLFASKYAYGYSRYSFPFGIPFFDGRIMASEPQRGDIIIFKGAISPSITFIKRLIGLPGDKIQIKKGLLFINGKQVQRQTKGLYENAAECVTGGTKTCYQYQETLPNGVSYTVLDANIHNHNEFPDTTPVYEVPEGHYFFMGDNRNNSKDSRFLNEMGFIPSENLIGKATFIMWTEDFSIIDLITKQKAGRALKSLS